MSRRLLIPLLALLITIAGVLIAAAWNRGDVRQRLLLTERELSLPWPWRHATTEEPEELRLTIEWQRRDDAIDERAWLTDDRLRDLGFDVSTPAGAPEAEYHYGRALPRLGWVVLEYDGPAWRALRQRRQLRLDPANPRAVYGGSRLVPIDAGKDPEVLARRHGAEAVLILPAQFQLRWLPATSGGPLVYGTMDSLVPRDLSVPRRPREVLEQVRTSRRDEPLTASETAAVAEPSPRYEVDLAVGRMGLPWVVGVRPTPQTAGAPE